MAMMFLITWNFVALYGTFHYGFSWHGTEQKQYFKIKKCSGGLKIKKIFLCLSYMSLISCIKFCMIHILCHFSIIPLYLQPCESLISGQEFQIKFHIKCYEQQLEFNITNWHYCVSLHINLNLLGERQDPSSLVFTPFI